MQTYESTTQKPPETAAPFISRSHIKARGWSEREIDTRLGKPDALAPSPYHGRLKMRLYSLARVEAAEVDENWIPRPRKRQEHHDFYSVSGDRFIRPED